MFAKTDSLFNNFMVQNDDTWNKRKKQTFVNLIKLTPTDVSNVIMSFKVNLSLCRDCTEALVQNPP